MTPELLYQRRWERIAELVGGQGLDPVILPPAEGGGLLIIQGPDWYPKPERVLAFHFTNLEAVVNVDVAVADTGELLEGRRNCFRFDAPLAETALRVVEQLAGS